MAQAKFETFKGEDGKIYARLKASNGETLFTSEGYERDSSAENAIFSLIGTIQASYYDIVFRTD